jgi:c-di-GMP-binding flagellar brake protein YcgR
MEKLKVFVVAGTHIQVEVEGLEERFKSEVVGIDGESYLIIKTPAALSAGLARSHLAPGNEVVVRYLYRGTVWGFRSSILQSLVGRFRVVFITYPTEVENYDLRAAERIDARIPAAVSCRDRTVGGMILDLSVTGARLVYKTGGENPPKPELEETVRISAHFAGAADSCAIEAVVRNRSEDATRIVLGLEFRNLEPATTEQIDRYIRDVEEFQGR